VEELEVRKREYLDLENYHRETVLKMEKKFFEEKYRLQKEANRQIAELAEKANKVYKWSVSLKSFDQIL
jgi:hypothetical protein